MLPRKLRQFWWKQSLSKYPANIHNVSLGLTTSMEWLLFLQLTVLSRPAIASILLENESWDVRSCISVLSVSSPLLLWRGPLRVRYLSSRYPVLVRIRSMVGVGASSSGDVDFHERTMDGQRFCHFPFVRCPFALFGKMRQRQH